MVAAGLRGGDKRLDADLVEDAQDPLRFAAGPLPFLGVCGLLFRDVDVDAFEVVDVGVFNFELAGGGAGGWS